MPLFGPSMLLGIEGCSIYSESMEWLSGCLLTTDSKNNLQIEGEGNIEEFVLTIAGLRSWRLARSRIEPRLIFRQAQPIRLNFPQCALSPQRFPHILYRWVFCAITLSSQDECSGYSFAYLLQTSLLSVRGAPSRGSHAFDLVHATMHGDQEIAKANELSKMSSCFIVDFQVQR